MCQHRVVLIKNRLRIGAAIFELKTDHLRRAVFFEQSLELRLPPDQNDSRLHRRLLRHRGVSEPFQSSLKTPFAHC